MQKLQLLPGPMHYPGDILDKIAQMHTDAKQDADESDCSKQAPRQQIKLLHLQHDMHY